MPIRSFEIDHTKLLPGIYIAGIKQHKQYGTITKFDIRFCRPNKEKITPKAIHSLEHLLAVYLSEELGNRYIDLSPMGCRTGFYLTLFGDVNPSVLPDWGQALAWIRQQKKVPGATKKTCGSAAEHDYRGAIKALEKFIKTTSK